MTGAAEERVQQVEERVRKVVRALVGIYGVQAPVMARAIGRSRATWFSRLKGDTAFTIGELYLLAELFGVPLEGFCSGHFDLPETLTLNLPDGEARPAGFEPATYRLEGRSFALIEDAPFSLTVVG